MRLRESQQTLPHSDVITAKLEHSSSPTTFEDGGRDPRVVLVTDPNCSDSDTWSGWMKSKQNFVVPCGYSDSGPIELSKSDDSPFWTGL